MEVTVKLKVNSLAQKRARVLRRDVPEVRLSDDFFDQIS